MLAGEKFLSGSTPGHGERMLRDAREGEARFLQGRRCGLSADNDDERLEMRTDMDTKTWGRMRAGHNTKVWPCGDPGDVGAGHSPDNAETWGDGRPTKTTSGWGRASTKTTGRRALMRTMETSGWVHVRIMATGDVGAGCSPDNGDERVGSRADKGDGWLGSRVEKGDEQMGLHADKGDGRVESSANKD
ncbi:hypothetical protein B0H14DRAFT_2656193, partial [Mycena olivaceomarginata]